MRSCTKVRQKGFISSDIVNLRKITVFNPRIEKDRCSFIKSDTFYESSLLVFIEVVKYNEEKCK